MVLLLFLISTGLLDEENIIEPKSFKVEQNYPNPFNGKTIINYSLTSADNLSFELYNILGEQIYFKDLGYTQSGSYQFQLDTASLLSGCAYLRNLLLCIYWNQ